MGVDVFDEAKRSEIMSRIKSRGNRSTEGRLRGQLVAAGIRGWRMQARDLPGSPDFVFDSERVAVFVDGCFWHGCKRCRNIPASNRRFWQEKIEGNRRRDRRVSRALRRDGWSVVRIWEHDLKSGKKALRRVQRALAHD